jgi:hypothetical protein
MDLAVRGDRRLVAAAGGRASALTATQPFRPFCVEVRRAVSGRLDHGVEREFGARQDLWCATAVID